MTRPSNFHSPATEGSLVRRLRYRSQFILGPRYADTEPFEHWQRFEVHSSVYLTVHPDLNTCIYRENGKTIALLGYILDPKHPESSDGEILKNLLTGMGDAGAHRCTYNLGGRWILIIDDGHTLRLFNDAAGLRQVFFAREAATDAVWCASQPVVLAGLLHRHMSPEAEDFIDSYAFRANPEFRWPGDGSPFEGICHLLPNHELDIQSGTSRRYFPDEGLDELPLDRATQQVGELLSALLVAAARRFKLALSLTAGLDSRMVLAAARSIQKEIGIMTVRQIDKPDDHMDISIPADLLAKIGLDHDIVPSSLILDDPFFQIFLQNAKPAHYIYLPDAFAIYKRYGLARVAVTGSVSEIGRLSFRNQLGKPETQKITAHDLAKLQKMGRHPYAIRSFKKWLGSREPMDAIPLLDLFEWEQGHGNWLAMCQSEFDIAWQDIFSPFNCRRILMTMLSVPAQYRTGPGHELFVRIIERLWPELLEVPINPGGKGRYRPIQQLKSVVPFPVKEYVKSTLKRDDDQDLTNNP
jgi:hypothetical protein